MSKIKLHCDCTTHIIEITHDTCDKKGQLFDDLWISIYDIYSPKTGRKYKRPKLTGDVVLVDNYYPKELTKFFEYIKKIAKRRDKK